MTEELITRMSQLVRTIAKDCDFCGKHNTSFCGTCWGSIAKNIVKDIDFKPASNYDQNEVLDIFSKLFEKGYTPISPLAKECGMTVKHIRTLLKRLEREGLVELKDNKWVRRK